MDAPTRTLRLLAVASPLLLLGNRVSAEVVSLAPAEVVLAAAPSESSPGTSPAVAIGAQGSALVAWAAGGFPGKTCSSGGTVARRLRIALDGSPVGSKIELDTIRTGPNHTAAVQVGGDSSGDFVAVWENQCLWDVYVRRLRANGAGRGEEFSAFGDGSSKQDPRLGVADDGRFALAWDDYRNLPSDPSPLRRIRLARFGPDGVRLGRPVTLRRHDEEASRLGGVAASPRFIVAAWIEPGVDACPLASVAVAVLGWEPGAEPRITRYVRRGICGGDPAVLAVLGSAVGPAVVVSQFDDYLLLRLSPETGTLVGSTVFARRDRSDRLAAIAGDSRGRLLAVLERRSGAAETERNDLYVQLFGREGRARSPRVRINRESSRRPIHAQAALAAYGSAVVAWATDLGPGHTGRRILARTLRFH